MFLSDPFCFLEDMLVCSNIKLVFSKQKTSTVTWYILYYGIRTVSVIAVMKLKALFMSNTWGQDLDPDMKMETNSPVITISDNDMEVFWPNIGEI